MRRSPILRAIGTVPALHTSTERGGLDRLLETELE